jgi:hypothetical protein
LAYRDQQHQDVPERYVDHVHVVAHQDAAAVRVQLPDADGFLSLDDPACRQFQSKFGWYGLFR